jgi:cellulose synthase/poly-beta-1,6-N-acetylglucosamine synthase-like glycosyltransferase
MSLLPIALLLLWLAWCTQATLAALQVRRFAKVVGKKLRPQYLRHQPHAVVIVPFKGVDQDLAGGVASLCAQDYPDYRLLLVVDSTSDPAYPVLLQQLAKFPHVRAQVLVAGAAGPDEGQKVHNQLFAIDTLLAEKPAIPTNHREQSAWVFADSDAVPGPLWLANMVGPLKRKRHGLVTGYRWLLPQDGGLWSRFASVINSSAAAFLGQRRFNHAWGGSMALRSGLAIEGDLRGKLTGALCDDYQFTALCKSRGLRVYFSSRCLVPTPVRFTRASFWNFAHRQYLLTRVYAPRLFWGSLAVLTLYLAGAISAWASLLWSVMRRPGEVWGWLVPAVAIAWVMAFNQWRASQRCKAIRRNLGDAVLAQLGPTQRLDRWCTTAAVAIHWLVVARTLLGRTMVWRGMRYHLDAPQRVRRLDG